MTNRWGNNGNSDRLYFLGLQNHCGQWLQPWNWKTLVPWKKSYDQPRSDQISRSVVSDSLRPHESQHTRPPCTSPTPGVHSDSRPSSQWCHPARSSSVIPFSSCPQSLPGSESFPMSQLFTWGGQSQKWQNDLCSFPRQTIQYHSNPSLCPNQ